MKKSWDVVVDGEKYHIVWKNRVVQVNDQELKVKSLPMERKMTFGRWTVPVGNAQAYFYGSGWLTSGGNRLVINGKDCETGEEYMPLEKLPVWAYIFLALHAVNFVNGAIGALLAIAGVTVTISIVSNRKMHTALKGLLCLCVLAASAAVVIGLVLTMAQIQYGI